MSKFPSSLLLSLTAAATLTLLAGTVQARCVGDCSADNEVTVDEIITGVNIALGTAALDTCLAFDGNGDSVVTVDEILTAITNALTGCPPVGGVCGDGNVDFDQGETCDDGNTLEGDACPSNCRIESCTSAGTARDVDVSFDPNQDVDLAALTIFVRYPDGVVRIPGMGNNASVQSRILNLASEVSATPNDLDYALRLVAFTPDLSPIAEGAFFTIQFDDCSGAAAPAIEDFTCSVESAGDIDLNSVEGVTCELSF